MRSGEYGVVLGTGIWNLLNIRAIDRPFLRAKISLRRKMVCHPIEIEPSFQVTVSWSSMSKNRVTPSIKR